MSSGFYRAFEDRFRGSHELIKSRLEVYLPFIRPIREIYPNSQILDLGCGRGEWLELMRDEGFDVQGVDLDQGMLEACRERELSVFQGDAISYLKSMEEKSISIVSGFHIVEHIPFEALQELVAEALRVLKPGGLLILETPNPENIVVGTANFYMDPTHRQPLPPNLLAFLPEYHGFARVKILRLQEQREIINNPNVSLLDVLSGVSPDYAVVAQKGGSEKSFNDLNKAFSVEYGLTLETLANKYQLRIDEKTQQAEAKAQQAEAKTQQAEAKAQQAEAKAQQAEAKAQQAEAKAQQAEAKIEKLYQSPLWRMTKPLRVLLGGIQFLIQKFRR